MGTAAVEYGHRIYLTDRQSRTVRCYDLESGAEEILLREVSVDSLALNYPELWMVEGSRRLCKLDLTTGEVEEVYTGQRELNGLLFLYGNNVYFEEYAEDGNVDCKQLDRATGSCTIFLENSGIEHPFHVAFYDGRLYFTSTGGPAYCVTMDEEEDRKIVDEEDWFTVVGTDSALYCSKYVDGAMKILQYEPDRAILDDYGYSFLQVRGSVGETLYAEGNMDGKTQLVQVDAQGAAVVFDNCAEYVYSDQPSVFYYLDSGILFWSNRAFPDSGDASEDAYYICFYAFSNGQFQLLATLPP